MDVAGPGIECVAEEKAKRKIHKATRNVNDIHTDNWSRNQGSEFSMPELRFLKIFTRTTTSQSLLVTNHLK